MGRRVILCDRCLTNSCVSAMFRCKGMESKSKSKVDRREVQSLYMENVPRIVLNSTEKGDGDSHGQMPHSRSAGELATASSDSTAVSDTSGNALKPRSFQCNGDTEHRTTIDIYCSPRMSRRSINLELARQAEQDAAFWGEGYDHAHTQNALVPGSRVGSAISLISEYTSRSIGLISNDSSSDSTQYSDRIDAVKQKQSYLRRFYSNPEKDQPETNEKIDRNAKSWHNLCEERNNSVDFSEIERKLTEESLTALQSLSTEEVSAEMEKTHNDYYEDISDNISTDSTLVTMVTGDSSLREGRIRKWLNDVSGDR